MDTRIVEHHGNAETVNWKNEDSVVNYMIKGFALMSGRKKFDKVKSEKYIRDEFQRANNYISMFNHAALQGGEQYWNRLNEIKQPTLIIHGTDDKIWHFKNTSVLLDKIPSSKLLTLEGTGHELHFEDWNTIIDGIAKHIND
jgi:pimeloyl-ACP methyl ester carboxylesterase